MLRYAAYEWSERGRWAAAERRTINVRLDGTTQTQLLDASKRLELSVSSAGASSLQLGAEMYYAEALRDGVYGELRRQPLNELAQYRWAGGLATGRRLACLVGRFW